MERQVSTSEDASVYVQIKELLVTYAFFPGDRLHVPELADQLRVSATPVREALNRFCAEGLLTSVPHRGFFVKKLDQDEVADLFAMKHMLLSYAVQGSLSDLELVEAEQRVLERLAGLSSRGRDPSAQLDVYERYATPMIMLAGSLAENGALLGCLGNVLDKLHFVRRTEVRMEDRAENVFQECAGIAKSLLSRCEGDLRALLDQQLRREQTMLTTLMKECVNRLYLRGKPPTAGQVSGRRARMTLLSA